MSRLEIARDLHDILAHTISVITVHAGVGQDAIARGSDGAASALATIRTAGREATEELKVLAIALPISVINGAIGYLTRRRESP